MLKHRFYIFFAAVMMVLTVSGQQDSKAREILDNVSQNYSQSDGLQISFKGTQQGTLWVKGEKFVLECGGVKSWFDGKTQWSYVPENKEVNISSPTPEEIQSVNPYILVTMYRNGFNYQFKGQSSRGGKTGNEIILKPTSRLDIHNFILLVSDDNIPLYIGVDMVNGHYEEFVVKSFKEKSLSDDFFQFDMDSYPDAEVIDLR